MLAVIFDMDGVIFDTEAICLRAWRACAEKYNIKDMDALLMPCIGGNKQHMREVFREQLGEDFPVDAFDKDAQKEFRRIEREEGIPVKKGARELLAWLKENEATVGLASSTAYDNVVAVLDTRDYFRAPKRTRNYIMENLADKASFVPESMKANTMFRQMKESRQYFNVIVNEYGGVCGIITLHDIMEALVGDLADQEEAAKPDDIVQLSEREWKIQGAASLEEVEEKLQVELPHDGSETFNGFICGLTGRIPRDGESFLCSCGPLHIHVLDVKQHVVVEGIVTKDAEAPAEEE